MLLLARPYEGVRSDGVLYFGQALRRSLLPGLSTDLFFAGGSQDTFSMYSRLLTPLYYTVGPAVTHQALLLIGLLASTYAVLRLLRHWHVQPVWGLLALAVMSSLYGGLRMFGVTENFLTARSLAEPLVLFSLLPLAKGQLHRGALWQVAAALFHPLMALPALVITWLLAAQRDHRWLWLLAALLAGIALGMASVSPFTRLTEVYDTFWWSKVSASNVQVLLSNWHWADALKLATDIALLVAVACCDLLPEAGRRLLLAVTLTTSGLLVASFAGTDVLHSVLLTQLQPWRVLWLTHLLATAMAPYLLWRTWQREGLWRLSAAFLAVALMNNHAGHDYGAPLLAGWATTACCAWRGIRVSTRVTALGVGACGLLLLVIASLQLSLEINRIHWRPPVSPALDVASHIVTTPLLVFTVAGAVALWWPGGIAWRRIGFGLCALGLTLALLNWDQRSVLDHAIESPPSPPPFGALIPANASVYWPEQLAGVWGLLQRESHYNRQQGAGMLFNRATAELMAPRRLAYTAIREDFERCEISALLGNSPAQLAACPTPAPARLRSLCEGAVHPDYIVVQQLLPPPPKATWSAGSMTMYLYDCTQFIVSTNSR